MRSLIRFGIAGICATLTHIAVFVVLVELLALKPLWASVPAFLAALAVSYGMNYAWTFQATGPHQAMFPRFVLVALTGLGLNLVIVWLVVDLGGYWYGYALAAVIAFVPLITFLLSKWWVFRQ